jgi:hypothetical protein
MNLETVVTLLMANIPLLGIFILIAGLIKVFSYYKLFGLYIFEFIDIKEVLTLMINNLLSYLIIIIALLVLLICKSFLTGILTYTLPVSFTVLSLLYFLLRKRVFLYEILFLNIFFWCFFFVVGQIQPQIIKQTSDSDLLKIDVLLFLLFTLIIYSIGNAFFEYYKVKYKKYYSKTKLLIENVEFNSTSEKYYIGKTEKFVFIHDNLDKSNEIIPVSLIKKIIFYEA